MSGNTQQARATHEMGPSFHPGTSQLTLLSLALLLTVPHPVTSYPHPLREDQAELELTLLRLQAALEDLGHAWLVPPEEDRRGSLQEAAGEEGEPWEEEEEEEELLRKQRGDLKAHLLPPAGSHSLENNALNFMAGGLQAVSREKGGFGFRFGRK